MKRLILLMAMLVLSMTWTVAVTVADGPNVLQSTMTADTNTAKTLISEAGSGVANVISEIQTAANTTDSSDLESSQLCNGKVYVISPATISTANEVGGMAYTALGVRTQAMMVTGVTSNTTMSMA